MNIERPTPYRQNYKRPVQHIKDTSKRRDPPEHPSSIRQRVSNDVRRLPVTIRDYDVYRKNMALLFGGIPAELRPEVGPPSAWRRATAGIRNRRNPSSALAGAPR